MASKRGAWERSEVTEYDILRLHRSRKIPDGVDCRIPGGVIALAPAKGEVVIFTSHFSRGFALPASHFFRTFLDRFSLQAHHLGPNAVMLVSSFAAFCEGYLGMRLNMYLWCRLYFLRSQSVSTVMSDCGAASVYTRWDTDYPMVKPVQSMNKWQRTFFYAKNVEPDVDFINLPAFEIAPPTAKQNWGTNPGLHSQEFANILDRMKVMRESEGLDAPDLVAAFVARRVQPLQRRTHRMCDMTLRLDPTRTSTAELSQRKWSIE